MHKHFLLAALNEAWQGRGICAPNPSVGALLTCDHHIIGRAHHQGAGQPHAEQSLLQNLENCPQNAVLYVTLEPCNHWGRTPPCVDFIIRQPIKQVVFAFKDMNPVVMKRDTSMILQQHGIKVVHHPLQEIDDFYKSYTHWIQTGKPWVSAKIAISLDGKIAAQDGRPVALSNQACQYYTHQQRQYTDVILTTARTILCDNPRLDTRLIANGRKKTLAILDRSLRLNGQEEVFALAEHCHIFYDEHLTLPISLSRKNSTYHPIATVDQQLILDKVLLQLGALGYHDIWVEAGGRLFSELHRQKLVNTNYFYITPHVLGQEAMPAFYASAWFQRPHKIAWQAEEDNMIMKVDWF